MSLRKNRNVTLSIPDSGKYVQVYQRIGEAPIADINFFDGKDHTTEQLKLMGNALVEASKLIELWND